MNPSRLNDGVEKLVKESNVERFTPHDLRRTAVTQMKKAGVSGEVRRRIVNHALARDVHDKVYDQTGWGDHKRNVTRRLMQYHNWLDRILHPEAPTPIRRVS